MQTIPVLALHGDPVGEMREWEKILLKLQIIQIASELFSTR